MCFVLNSFCFHQRLSSFDVKKDQLFVFKQPIDYLMLILITVSFGDFKSSHCFTIINRYHQYCHLAQYPSVSFDLFPVLEVKAEPSRLMNFFLCVELIWLRDLKSLNFSLPSFSFEYYLNSFANLLIYLMFFYFIQRNF
jgi:hypothetical protein